METEIRDPLREKAKALLAELESTGPSGLADWNVRAKALMTFLEIARLRDQVKLSPGEQAVPSRSL